MATRHQALTCSSFNSNHCAEKWEKHVCSHAISSCELSHATTPIPWSLLPLVSVSCSQCILCATGFCMNLKYCGRKHCLILHPVHKICDKMYRFYNGWPSEFWSMFNYGHIQPKVWAVHEKYLALEIWFNPRFSQVLEGQFFWDFKLLFLVYLKIFLCYNKIIICCPI